jgi:hypothetical protein
MTREKKNDEITVLERLQAACTPRLGLVERETNKQIFGVYLSLRFM